MSLEKDSEDNENEYEIQHIEEELQKKSKLKERHEETKQEETKKEKIIHILSAPSRY